MVEPRLHKYVYKLAELPELPPILLETKNQKLIFLSARERYKALSIWLRTFLLGEALPIEAITTNIQFYLPIAEMSAALFRLAVGVHPRSSLPLVCNFESPADLWFQCELIMSQESLEDDGLTGLPQPSGKREQEKEALQLVRQLEKLSYPVPQKKCPEDLLLAALILEAQELARADANFEVDYFRPFLRAFKPSVNKIRNCSELQSVYLLPNDKLFITGKHARPPKLNVK